MRALRLTAAVLLASSIGPAPAATGAAGEPRTVEITARRFAFAPATLTLRVGEPVRLRLHSEDVTHGFFLRPLGIDAVVEPGKVTEVVVTPRAPGRYTAICDHFCGSGHGNMRLTIVVE